MPDPRSTSRLFPLRQRAAWWALYTLAIYLLTLDVTREAAGEGVVDGGLRWWFPSVWPVLGTAALLALFGELPRRLCSPNTNEALADRGLLALFALTVLLLGLARIGQWVIPLHGLAEATAPLFGPALAETWAQDIKNGLLSEHPWPLLMPWLLPAALASRHLLAPASLWLIALTGLTVLLVFLLGTGATFGLLGYVLGASFLAEKGAGQHEANGVFLRGLGAASLLTAGVSVGLWLELPDARLGLMLGVALLFYTLASLVVARALAPIIAPLFERRPREETKVSPPDAP